MSEKTPRLPSVEYHLQEYSRVSPRSSVRKHICYVVFLVVVGLSLLSIKYRYEHRQKYHTFKDGDFDQNHDVDPGTDTKENGNLCVTPECIHAASEILHNLSPNHAEWDFCGDFEGTVCQGFREHHDLRPDQGEIYPATLMRERSESLMRHILEGQYADFDSEPESPFTKFADFAREADKQNFLKLKDTYNACLDKDAIEKVGLEPLLSILKELDEQKEISEALMYLAKLGASPLVSTGAGPDLRDSDTIVVFVWPPNSVGLPAKEFYLDDGIFKKYADVVEKIICVPHLRGFEESSCSSVAKGVVQFEKILAAALPEREDYVNLTKTYNPVALSDAEERTPLLHLSSFLKNLSPTGVQVDRIILEIPVSMKKINDILSETTNTTVRAYLRWKAIQHFASAVESEVLSPWKQLVNELLGKDPASAPERWRTCLQIVDDGLGWMLSRFFVQKSFNAESKQFAEDIVSDVQDQWVTKLKTIDWMEDEVKGRAVQKARNIIRKIGYPAKNPDITDPFDLQRYYQSINISTPSHFDNVVSINRFRIRLEWSTLGKPTDWDAWMRPATTVNAWYDPTGNEVNLPAGLLQLPIFSPSLPQYLSYGAFGSIAGHEISHAFDGIGRHVDETGNYTDWWPPSAVEAFNSRAQCFVSQYSHFAVPGPTLGSYLNVSGSRTLNENIADAGGIGAAFAAWKSRAKTEPKTANMDLPGLEEFSHEQLFFVGFANWFCSKSSRQMAIRHIHTDSHAPMWVRALGTTRNSREFKEAFGCKVREPTCELW